MYAAEVDHTLTLPLEDALDGLARLPEGQWFERKSGRVDPRDLAVPLVALANAEGGCVVVGFHGGVVDGVPRARVNALRQAAQDFTRPVVRARIEEIELASGGCVLILRVDPGEAVHETVKGDVYLRVGDESRRLGFAQRQELEFDRGSAPFDGTRAHVEIGDLDPEQVEAYQLAIGSATPNGMLRARGLLTGDGDPTVAAYLLFAESPQALYPNAHVRVLRYTDVERGSGSRLTLDDDADVRCEGSIPQQIDRAAHEIERLLPRRRALASSGRFAASGIVPRDAWLEGLVNAVLHRSYSMIGDHVRVEIFPDRVEISSPGRFPGIVKPDQPLDISRYARNPRIARVCSDLGIAQELGEGIRRMFDEMRSRGLTDPMYTQTQSGVRLILSALDTVPREVSDQFSRGARQVLEVLRVAGRPLGTGQVAELAELTRPTVIRHLQKLQELGVVVWEGQSPKDPRAVWRIA